MKPHLSIVIPCFNEARKIERDVEAALDYFSRRPYAFELVLVDDGSSDGTAARLRELARQHAPRVRAVCYEPNRGKGHAVRTGMQQAQGDYRLFADAGLCVPFPEAEKALELLANGADVAIASRRLADSRIVGQPAGYRRIGSKLFAFLMRNWMGLRYSDTQCGFKMFTARSAGILFGMSRIDGFMFDAEALVNARRQGLVVREFSVEWRADPDTRYKPLSGSLRNLLELVKIQLR